MDLWRRKAGVLTGILLALLIFSCLTVSADQSDDDFAMAVGKMAGTYQKGGSGAMAVADDYYSARLIVKGKNSKLTFEQYDAIDVIRSNSNVYLVQFESSGAAKQANKKLAGDSNVIYVEPDAYMGVNDTKSEKGASSGSSKFKSWGVEYIHADQYAAYLKKKTDKSITVAVVDSGVSKHPLIGNRLLPGYDFVDGDKKAADEFGHGTHVAGIISECTKGLNVNIFPVRVLNAAGGGDESVIGAGILYAANHGAKVINLSLGGGHRKFIDECVGYAVNKGAVVCVSSGNNYGKDTAEVCPAHIAKAIVVGAVNSHDQYAEFSNIGSSVDVVAPGVGIVSSVPGGRYEAMDGTSMAAPYVSAAAAMFRLTYPSKSVKEIEALIKKNVRDLGKKGKDPLYGNGVICLKVPDEKTTTVKPVALTLSESDVKMKTGESLILTASVKPLNATDKTVTWKTSKKDVVSVSDGKLTAKKAGTATITAKGSDGIEATCKVTVKKASADSIYKKIPEVDDMKPDSVKKSRAVAVKTGMNRLEGMNGYLKFTAPQSGTYEFTFSLQDEAGKKKGSGTCISGDTWICYNSSGTLLGMNFDRVETQNGYTNHIQFCAPKSKPFYKVYNSVMTYDEMDFIPNRFARIVLKKGKTIYFELNMSKVEEGDYTKYPAKLKLNVKKKGGMSAKAASIDLEKKSVTMYPGETFELRSEVRPVNASRKLKWKSNRSTVASVVGDDIIGGIITANKAGTAIITATAGNGVKSTCKVIVKKDPTGASFKKVPVTTYRDKDSVRVKRAVKVKTGTNKLSVGTAGFLKFKAPSTGTYEFTFSALDQKARKTDGKTVLSLAGYASFYTYDKYGLSSLSESSIRTQGGEYLILYFCSEGTKDHFSNESKYDLAERKIPDRYARIKMKKGKTLYIEVESQSSILLDNLDHFALPLKMNLTIKKK